MQSSLRVPTRKKTYLPYDAVNRRNSLEQADKTRLISEGQSSLMRSGSPAVLVNTVPPRLFSGFFLESSNCLYSQLEKTRRV